MSDTKMAGRESKVLLILFGKDALSKNLVWSNGPNLMLQRVNPPLFNSLGQGRRGNLLIFLTYSNFYLDDSCVLPSTRQKQSPFLEDSDAQS